MTIWSVAVNSSTNYRGKKKKLCLLNCMKVYLTCLQLPIVLLLVHSYFLKINSLFFMQRMERFKFLKCLKKKTQNKYSRETDKKKNYTLPLPIFGRARCSVTLGTLRPRPLKPLPRRNRPGTPNVSMFNFFSSAQVVLLKPYHKVKYVTGACVVWGQHV